MELRVFDHDYYNKDQSAQHVCSLLESTCDKMEGLWLYREPEIRTEGNELPTFTIVSPTLGVCFIKILTILAIGLQR